MFTAAIGSAIAVEAPIKCALFLAEHALAQIIAWKIVKREGVDRSRQMLGTGLGKPRRNGEASRHPSGPMNVRIYITALLAFLAAACATTPTNPEADISGSARPGRYSASALHVEGSRIVNRGGVDIRLKGINLGGWLVTEAWMCGFEDRTDTAEATGPGGGAGRSTEDSLAARFGHENAAALMTVWRDHWITAKDLDQIRDWGFNMVRVPFSYRTLQKANGEWIRNTRGQIDFARMDWIVEEAAKRGIYTIFDLHVWPEQRLSYDKIGRPEGGAIRIAMAELWTEVTMHYRGNGAIAAFDLINEFPGNWGVQQVLSQAVREADPTRVQIVEGFSFLEFQKLQAGGQFSNAVFSDHLYGVAPLKTEEISQGLAEMRESAAPVYIGEFLAADFDAVTRLMDDAGMSWSPWTYKTVDMGEWGILNYYGALRIDVQNDSFDAIRSKWAHQLTSWQTPDSPQNTYVMEKRRAAPSPVARPPLQ